MPSVIKNIIVLMLENRSFDRMLGFLKEHNPEIEGLTGTESNPTDPQLTGQGNVEMVTVSRLTGEEGYITDPDPHHEFPDVTFQLFGQESEPSPVIPKNNGFVASYSLVSGRTGVPIGVEKGKTIMKCFDPLTQLPVLSALAQNFLLCDHWFCSVPGPTWPNRFFVHAASSNGHVDSPSALEALKDEIAFSTYGMRTIYENLTEKNLSWKIYYHDFPHALALANLHRFPDSFRPFNEFQEDVGAGNLPNYTFIEPAYFNLPLSAASDQHPPHDVRAGERLLADIYNTLRGNETLWNQSLFVVLYDEHGGFYDHVPPPKAINPDGKVSVSPPFSFDRLGVRVPAILVSPYVGKGQVDHTIYDHTSLIATVKKLFDLPQFLTRRDATANTFEHRILDVARVDAPMTLVPTDSAPKQVEQSDVMQSMQGFSEFQRSLVKLATLINTAASPRTKLEGVNLAKDQLAKFFGIKVADSSRK